MLRFLAMLTLIAAPVQAERLDGASDPAFLAALTTLLAKDDPAAVAALRDLAEAGNQAALVTLPFALQWVPPKGNLKEKNAQRKVGGVNAKEAAAKVHPATDLWNMGQFDSALELPDRAAGLLALDEPEKAATLLYSWVSQTGGLADHPDDILSDDLPAMLGALALGDRLRAAVYYGGNPGEEAARLLAGMREDQLAAWITYVQLLEGSPEVVDVIGSPLAGTGLSATDTQARIEDARAVRAVWRAFVMGEEPTRAATAIRAREALQGRAELAPVANLCKAHCPETVASCEAAVLAYPGLIHPAFTALQPFASVLDPVDYAASDRGVFTLVRPRKDPAAAADRATAEGLDACYATILARRDALSFGP
jgi:hypothetical protein